MTPERRTRAREYARRKRAERLAAVNASASACQKRLGRSAICGGRLETGTDGNGRASTVCRNCERQRRGICRECGLPVAGAVGHAIRCAHHLAEARRRGERKYAAGNRETLRRKAREFYTLDEARRERKNERKRLWRKANPEKIKEYKRQESLRDNTKRRAYHAKRRERERFDLAARERARYHGVTELRTCISDGCDIVVTHRKKKCQRCKARDHQSALDHLRSLRGVA
jgi:hypothetical protein